MRLKYEDDCIMYHRNEPVVGDEERPTDTDPETEPVCALCSAVALDGDRGMHSQQEQ